jgi:hypothetical protein
MSIVQSERAEGAGADRSISSRTMGGGLTRSRWMSITTRKTLALAPLPPSGRRNGTPVKDDGGQVNAPDIGQEKLSL